MQVRVLKPDDKVAVLHPAVHLIMICFQPYHRHHLSAISPMSQVDLRDKLATEAFSSRYAIA